MAEWLRWAAPPAIVLSIASPAYATQYLSVEQAQKLAFPKATQFVWAPVVYTPGQGAAIEKLSGQKVLTTADDHRDVPSIYARAAEVDPRISISTVYRTMRLFVAVGILTKHRFSDGPSRFETEVHEHHDHLIDVSTGKIVEFQDEEVTRLQTTIVQKLGYRLIGYRLELVGTPLATSSRTARRAENILTVLSSSIADEPMSHGDDACGIGDRGYLGWGGVALPTVHESLFSARNGTRRTLGA